MEVSERDGTGRKQDDEVVLTSAERVVIEERMKAQDRNKPSMKHMDLLL